MIYMQNHVAAEGGLYFMILLQLSYIPSKEIMLSCLSI